MNQTYLSYSPEDAVFLLDAIPDRDARGQELLARINAEFVPDAKYLEFFWTAVRTNSMSLASDIISLAGQIARKKKGPITIVTLVRAGTPTGVLLVRTLRKMGREAYHYSLSAVRNRGLDLVALEAVIGNHEPESIVFVDGWSGKGAIASELHKSVASFCAHRDIAIDSSLAVLSDLAGVASTAANSRDYLIPFSMLLATVSGLISGTFPNLSNRNGFDSTIAFESLKTADISVQFADEIEDCVDRILSQPFQAPSWSESERMKAKAISNSFVEECKSRFGVERNSVKPGICEVNRAILTRNTPMILCYKNLQVLRADLAHSSILTRGKPVRSLYWPEMPYNAAIVLTDNLQ